jgi:hypothetical protein
VNARPVLLLAADVAVGILLTGLVAPLALAAVPAWLRGRALLGTVCLATIAVVSMFRRVARPRGGA